MSKTRICGCSSCSRGGSLSVLDFPLSFFYHEWPEVARYSPFFGNAMTYAMTCHDGSLPVMRLELGHALKYCDAVTKKVGPSSVIIHHEIGKRGRSVDPGLDLGLCTGKKQGRSALIKC